MRRSHRDASPLFQIRVGTRLFKLDLRPLTPVATTRALPLQRSRVPESMAVGVPAGEDYGRRTPFQVKLFRNVTCCLWPVVSCLSAIPISWMIPPRTLNTAVEAPFGARYQ